MDYWHKQTAQKPLFENLLWSRPENRLQAGKLLVAGGSAHGFAQPAAAFTAAERAGIGSTRVVLPVALQKAMPKGFMEAEFLPSTPSGSFAREALGGFLEHAAWADAVVLAGGFGRNSETAILIDLFLSEYSGAVVLSDDAADYAISAPHFVLERPTTLLACDFVQLQKFFVASRQPQALTSNMDLLRLVTLLHEFSAAYPLMIMTKLNENVLVAYQGQVSTTQLADTSAPLYVRAATASVWWLQNSSKTFEAVTTALVA